MTKYTINKSEWDSNFFGYPCAIAKVTGSSIDEKDYFLAADNIHSWLLLYKIKFCYAKVNKSEIHIISALKCFRFTEIEKGITYKLNDLKDTYHKHRICHFATSSDLPDLREIAIQSTYDRFTCDYHFSIREVRKFRRRWITTLFNDKNCFIIVAKIDRLVGYVACTVQDDIGIIKLIGVDNFYRRLGLGKQLIEFAVNIFKEKNINTVHVSTQLDNVPSNKLYQRCGFIKDTEFVTLHYWVEGT